MDLIAYCRDLVAPPGSPRYYIERAMPAPLRKAYCAIEALCQETAASVLDCTDPGIARIKLQWWHEELERLFAGSPRHPAAQAVLQTFTELPQESLRRFLAGIAAELEGTRYPQWNDIQEHQDRLGGSRWRALAANAGVRGQHGNALGNVGRALALSQAITALGQHLRRGRCPLPEALLANHDVDKAELLGLDIVAVGPLTAAAIEHVRQQLAVALNDLPDELRRDHIYAGVAVALENARLDEIERDGNRLLTHQVRLTPLRCAWIAWRAHRRERRC